MELLCKRSTEEQPTTRALKVGFISRIINKILQANWSQIPRPHVFKCSGEDNIIPGRPIWSKR
ncbi:hypothetical protein H5410_001889 [Solanum commersonii]|uniref:Uncharacterized protein n=1 Tax=Solanum commersonii TaxID=4109 RepID=A0A9J6B0H4_SOLCO|nr:hypothetical protein H5410_001889 [Solanum commersonii]